MAAKGNVYTLEGETVGFDKRQDQKNLENGERVKCWKYKYNLQGRLDKVYKNGDLIVDVN